MNSGSLKACRRKLVPPCERMRDLPMTTGSQNERDIELFRQSEVCGRNERFDFNSAMFNSFSCERQR